MRIDIAKENIKTALPNVEEGLSKYRAIQAGIKEVDITRDTDLQRKFNHFYRLRRAENYRRKVYKLIQEKETNFEKVLKKLSVNGSVEKSFASKVVATVNSNFPIIDSIVLKNIGASTAKYTASSAIELYEEMQKLYKDFLSSEEGKRVIKMFDECFKGSGMTNVKKLDFILWQTRGQRKKKSSATKVKKG